MKILCIGGGPAGLYFAILAKKLNPAHEVTVWERNAPDDTFGFGVVFSDQTLGHLAEADPQSYQEITDQFVHWDDIDVHYDGQVYTSTGHGFAGMSRHKLLEILQRRCLALGVDLQFNREVSTQEEQEAQADLIVCADGVNSAIRGRYAADFLPHVDFRPNHFIWLGTTRFFPAFTFYFKEHAAGLFRVHAYSYAPEQSTFIVECTDATWRAAGLDKTTEAESAAFCHALFAEELQGHALLTNRSIWRQFPNISCERWHVGNRVLLGDAVHTAHFSIGSGTKLAMEDAIDLANAIQNEPHLNQALENYTASRLPAIQSVQRSAQVSLEWFENTERYYGKLAPLQFTFSLLTRSLRITHKNLKMRDPAFVDEVDRWFMRDVERISGLALNARRTIPPMFTPFKLRDLVIPNRVVVSPMSMYSATDGKVDDFHLVHLGSRAMGGAGLVVAEMTDVSPEGRITPGCAGMYKPEHVGAWRKITQFVHQHTPSKIALQLGHAGRKGATRVAWEGTDLPLLEGDWPILAPSPLPYLRQSQVPKAMDQADMAKVIADFVRATEGAEEAGFDLLEIHFAHGYLLSSFLSPLTNKRTDEYGGSLSNRMRFPLEVFHAVRKVWPDHKPLAVRISATDWAPGGFESDDAVEVARTLKAAGCDLVDVSTGQVVADAKPKYGRLYQTPFAERIRLEVDIPTMAVGNISSFEDVNSIIVAGRADLCAIARAHLFDPYWTRHAAIEQGYDLPWPNAYGSIQRYKPR